jgi:hypothetical protein
LRRNAFLVACSGLAPVVSWASVIAGLLAWRLDGLPIIAAVATTLGFFGVVTQGAVLTRVFARGGMPPIGVLGWAIGCLLVTKTLLDGAADLRRGRPIRWGGRTYHLQPGPP